MTIPKPVVETKLIKVPGVKLVVRVGLDADGEVIGFPTTYTAQTIASLKKSNENQDAFIAELEAKLVEE